MNKKEYQQPFSKKDLKMFDFLIGKFDENLIVKKKRARARNLRRISKK